MLCSTVVAAPEAGAASIVLSGSGPGYCGDNTGCPVGK
jgi:hypothetical protein